MTQANYALRLQSAIEGRSRAVGKAEGTTLNQFINDGREDRRYLRRISFVIGRGARMRRGRWHCSTVSAGTAPRAGDELEG